MYWVSGNEGLAYFVNKAVNHYYKGRLVVMYWVSGNEELARSVNKTVKFYCKNLPFLLLFVCFFLCFVLYCTVSVLTRHVLIL